MNTAFCSAHMELSIPSELGYEIIVRDAVAAFARRMGFTPDRIEDLKTALCEACINAIEHGNLLKADKRVSVACIGDQNRIQVEVHDQGLKRYAPGHCPISIADKLARPGSMRGMGLLLIAQLVDEAGFAPDIHEGNTFRFTIYHRPFMSNT